MSKVGYRPGSGRKPGFTAWNKGLPMSKESKEKISKSKKGKTAWNKGKKMPYLSLKMMGNTNGKGNKGRSMSEEWRAKLSMAKKGKPSNARGTKYSIERRVRMSIARRQAYKILGFKYSYEPKDVLRRDRKSVRLNRIRKNGGYHSRAEWEEMKKQSNYSCAICDRSEPEIKLTRDHIIAVAQGGSDNIENIQPLCVSCNSKKGINLK